MNQPDKSLRTETILKTLRPKRFSSVDILGVEKPAQALIRGAIKSLFTDKETGLVLTGGVGTGKSSILYILRDAFIVANNLRLDDPSLADYEGLKISCRIFPIVGHFELVARLRRAIQDNEPCDLKGKGFLAIDDLGRGYEDDAGWNLALLEEFIDYRWSHNLLTAISTNLTISELRSHVGWGRIVDRLLDPSWNVLVSLGKGSRRK